MITPVIMAGGSGSRLWPLSRSLYPKQFLSLNGHKTMLQQTLNRLTGLSVNSPIVICNEEHRFIVAEQLRTINLTGDIILEPVGRNTAPAIALASKVVMRSKDNLILVLAADHVIENEAAFVAAVKKATPLAESGKLVTFGIVPTEAHTGYGYIKRGALFDIDGYHVDAFVEKPCAELAMEYVDGKEHYWNSGMFLMKASRYLEELKQFRPDIYQACEASLATTSKDADFIRIDEIAFGKCPDESVDYAVMEKTLDAVVVALDAGWSDIGSWSALWDVNSKDANGNAISGDSINYETTNTLIHGSERLIATVGVDNLVIVDTKDALLVAAKDKVQDVKKIVEQLKAESRGEFKNHREVYRPWGKYDSIDNGKRYQVKRITVKPGEKLSIQMHHHRAEHWVVVSGTAKVTNGDKTFLVTENESTYIPIGVIHALENPGQLPLEMIEVQSGSYLGEDDIVRFEDRYGRV
jgi:mannose-1-phosphate guanylyltransferase